MKGVGVSFFISFVLIANLQNTESKRMSLDEIKIALLPVREVCIERVSVNPKMIDDANNGNFVPDRKLQCYYKCLLLMTKVMKNDQIIEKALHNIVQFMLNEDLASPVENAIKHCQPIMSKSIDGCELAYETVKCFYDSNSLILFP
ncbi:general odorant-binding protein 69a-like isoform X1 [Formica exsecta]|uniref:general odorant-binding protein 69a-like isoform X1 n=2 Tax=Formica exsecta TaxID=72781 RepID=UPI0011415596|nr:general odorant-binding protein 69a-like isoform X1 [Formica exsecta]